MRESTQRINYGRVGRIVHPEVAEHAAIPESPNDAGTK